MILFAKGLRTELLVYPLRIYPSGYHKKDNSSTVLQQFILILNGMEPLLKALLVSNEIGQHSAKLKHPIGQEQGV